MAARNYQALTVSAAYRCVTCNSEAPATEPEYEASQQGKLWEIPRGWIELRHNRAEHQAVAIIGNSVVYCSTDCLLIDVVNKGIRTRAGDGLDDIPF
jgi:hypothetical protein